MHCENIAVAHVTEPGGLEVSADGFGFPRTCQVASSFASGMKNKADDRYDQGAYATPRRTAGSDNGRCLASKAYDGDEWGSQCAK